MGAGNSPSAAVLQPLRASQHAPSGVCIMPLTRGAPFALLLSAICCSMLHDVGTDTSSKFSVIMDSRMNDGNLGEGLQQGLEEGSAGEHVLEGAALWPLSAGPQGWRAHRSRPAAQPCRQVSSAEPALAPHLATPLLCCCPSCRPSPVCSTCSKLGVAMPSNGSVGPSGKERLLSHARQGTPAWLARPMLPSRFTLKPLPCSGLSGPTLYTNINVGKGTNALYSGGPSRSGANAAAGTTWWFIQRQGRGVTSCAPAGCANPESSAALALCRRAMLSAQRAGAGAHPGHCVATWMLRLAAAAEGH